MEAGLAEGKKVSPKKYRRQTRNTNAKQKGTGVERKKLQKKRGLVELMEVDEGKEPEQKKAKGEGFSEETNTNDAGLSEQPCGSK